MQDTTLKVNIIFLTDISASIDYFCKSAVVLENDSNIHVQINNISTLINKVHYE